MLGASSEGARTLRARRGHGGDRPRLARSARSATRSPTATARRCSPALERLAGAYERGRDRRLDRLGPRARRARSRRRSRRAGHKLDGSPVAMSLELERLRPAELGDLDWESDADPAELGPHQRPRLRSLARAGMAPGADDAAGRGGASERRAIDGEPACVLGDDRPRRRPRRLLRRHPPRAPRARPRQPAGDRGAARRPRARPAQPRRCRARRWAARSTPGSATRPTSRCACTSAGGRDDDPVRGGARGGARARSREPGRFDEAEALVSRARRRGCSGSSARRSTPAAGSRSRTRPRWRKALAGDDPEERARARPGAARRGGADGDDGRRRRRLGAGRGAAQRQEDADENRVHRPRDLRALRRRREAC